jgi:RNA recognition motif-containing protein
LNQKKAAFIFKSYCFSDFNPIFVLYLLIFFYMKIYVGNLSYDLSENDLKDVFTPYGEVASVKIMTDKFTGRSKGFAFVEMPNDAEANNAINGLNDVEVAQRSIKVNEARERTFDNNRPRSGGGFNRGGDRGGYNRGGDRGGYNRGGNDGGSRY